MNTKDVYIVAGGPSLKEFDFDQLRGKDVIAINNAAFECPFARYVYFCNKDWFDKWRWQLLHHKAKIIQGSDPAETDNVVYEPWVERWAFTKATGLALEPFTLSTGINSGYAAINLAVQLGYKRIYLLGYDMKWKDGASHFHHDHDWTAPESKYAEFIARFDTMLDDLKRLNVQVINCTPDSALKCFPLAVIENDETGVTCVTCRT